MKKHFQSFTLVEMLIVMGIIIILMAVGIASGRFAIRRANKIEHQNAAGNIYQALQSYYIENREYPPQYQTDGVTANTPKLLTSSGGLLDEYIDDFDGGSEASYTYAVDDTQQEALICVTYGGIADGNYMGIFCTGNGIDGDIEYAPSIKDISWDDIDDYRNAAALFEFDKCSNWEPEGWQDEGCTGLRSGPTPP